MLGRGRVRPAPGRGRRDREHSRCLGRRDVGRLPGRHARTGATATASLRSCFAKDGRAGSTITPPSARPQPRVPASTGSARRSVIRSWSVEASGAPSSRRGSAPSRARPRPRAASRSSPTWSPPPSPTPRRARRWSGSPHEQAALRRVATLVAEGAPRHRGLRRRGRGDGGAARRRRGLAEPLRARRARSPCVAHRGSGARAWCRPARGSASRVTNVDGDGAAHGAARPDGHFEEAQRPDR